MTEFVEWLNGLAEKGGKGVVNNIDARCLGRIATALEAKDKELAALRERIDNAAQASAETQPDWKHRCFRIMGALGFDYGDPDWVMPDERKRIDAAEAHAETAERERDHFKSKAHEYFGWYDKALRERDEAREALRFAEQMISEHIEKFHDFEYEPHQVPQELAQLRGVQHHLLGSLTDENGEPFRAARAITGEKP